MKGRRGSVLFPCLVNPNREEDTMIDEAKTISRGSPLEGVENGFIWVYLSFQGRKRPMFSLDSPENRL
jgi:hypothetical protein